ncbi:MAG TPA: hypothetical protein VNO70_27780 [Blastocatellia bacterium]|nr:hypothetical protein [Blastocatellia bacterium]
MSESLTFAKSHYYDTRKAGITLPVILQSGSNTIGLEAKLDTGSSYCVFKRAQGEFLGLDIESGIPQLMRTVTGDFLTCGHEVTLSVLGIETVTRVYFAADENFTRNVLGRQGWLDRVRLGLVDYEGKLYLSAYDDVV